MTSPVGEAAKAVPALLLAVVVMLTACTSTPAAEPTETQNSTSSIDPARPFDDTRPAGIVFTEFLNTIEEIVKASGTTFPNWNREDRAEYNAGACGVRSREDGRKYTTQIEGGPLTDPAQAVQTMKTNWENKGYTIGNIFTSMGGNKGAQQINATTPQGIFVQYTPGLSKTSVKVQSDCTLDPLARQTTTETTP